MHDYLRDIIPRYAGISPVLVQAEMLAGEQGAREAADFITAHLGRRPSVRGFARLIEFGSAAAADSETEFLELLRALVQELRQDKPLYSCHECGFAGKTLHWQCPGCRQWDSVRPIHGVEGD
jgi:lipopolysaccharide biosynthesis regulator YciM